MRNAHALMRRAGQQSNVLNIDPRAPQSSAYIKISGGLDLAVELVRHVWKDWALHVHINGHNRKSWAIAFACGLAAQCGPGAMLTLHSGMTPSFIQVAPGWIRRGIRFTCLLYGQVVCVNPEIAGAISGLGIDAEKLRIAPAFLPFEAPVIPVPPDIEAWLNQHSPVIATTMFFRPEYGFELLVEAIERLRVRYPKVGCLVMGSGENRAEASALLTSRGLTGAMFLAGDLDHDICLALMSRSGVFVRPTFRDGDSISVREAVALDVPVVASNVGTRPENVFLFEAGDVDGLTRQVERALLSCRGGL